MLLHAAARTGHDDRAVSDRICLLDLGGMVDVYPATHTRLHRSVAIKLIAAELSANHELQTRFEREAWVLAALVHPHVAAIDGLEERDGVRALVLEFVEGRAPIG